MFKKKENEQLFVVCIIITALVFLAVALPNIKKASDEGEAYAAKVSWHLYWVEGKEIKHAEIQRGFKPRFGNFTFETTTGEKLVISQETRHKITNFENTNTEELLKK